MTIVNGLKLLIIVAKLSTWDVCIGPGRALILEAKFSDNPLSKLHFVLKFKKVKQTIAW